MKKLLFTFLILWSSLKGWAQHNNVETFTTANGLGNQGCTGLALEPNGTLWVGHDFFGNPSLNNKPFSRRLANGSWDYPFNAAGLPMVTVNGSSYQWASFSVKEIRRTSNGAIWFIPNAGNISDMNLAPPLLVYHNGSFTVYHISLANFPNKGAVHTMMQDGYGHIWFGCQTGLIKLDAITNNFTTYNPPVVNFGGASHSSTRVFSLDYDLNNRVLMVTGNPISISGTSSLVRIFTPLTNTWEYWTHYDAPWKNAIQTFYVPKDIVASRNADNRVYISSDGGGYYYVDNSDWSSHSLNQIADFVRGWSYPGYSFENVYTNLPSFTKDLFIDNENELWLFAINGTEINTYKLMYETPTLFSGNPATYYLFGHKKSQHLYNNNGTMRHSRYQDMVFSDEGEIWISSEHGLEHWYLDSLKPSSDYIGLEGAGAKKQGAVGFNTQTGNAREPQNTGHDMPTAWPSISIDTAYYYLASSDYENLVAGQGSGITGTGEYQGFAKTAAALSAAGFDFSDLKLRFSAVGLGNDKRTGDWDWNDPLETRTYQTWFAVNGTDVSPQSHYELVLNGHVLFKGQMPDLHMEINYNRFGYLFDSIGAYTDYTPFSPNPSLTDPNALLVRDSLLSDLGAAGVRFVFRSIQPALNEEIRTADRRGGVFQIYDAYLQKDTAAAPPVPNRPMCGDYSIGQSINDDYPSFSAAVADLEARGIICDVNFQVGKGSYQEQVELGAVEGMDVYHISFDGMGSNPTLQYNPAHADSNYVFKVSTTDNLEFKDLRFKNTGANFGGVLLLQNGINNFTLANCELEGVSNAPNTPASSADRHILFSCSNCDSLLIEESEFIAGADGVNASGSVQKIRNNEFSENTRIAIDLGSADEIHVTENLILGSSGSFSGIRFGDHPFLISRNQIINSTGDCYYAIYSWSFSTGSALNPGQIWNNEISIQSTAGARAALSLAVENVQVYHNSIKVGGNNSAYVGLDNSFMTNGWVARNNIIVNDNGYCFSASSLDNPAVFPDNDYNIYYSSAASPFKVETNAGTATHANLAALQGVIASDANSQFIDPQFADNQQLLVMNAAAKNNATLVGNLSVDILNRERPNVNRDHGCYEFDGQGWLGSLDSDWRKPANWSGNSVPGASAKVFISPRVNNPVIDTVWQVQEFIMHREASLTILPGAGLQIDSLLNSEGTITLQADTSGKYGQLIQNRVSGNSNIIQMAFLDAADTAVRWFHLGVPMQTKIADLANPGTHIVAGRAGASIYAWDANAGNWVSPSDTAAFIGPGQGYVVAAGENASGNFLVDSFPSILSFQGNLDSVLGQKTESLGYTNVPSFNAYTSAITDGWNLLANPYHAVYDTKNQSLPGSYKTIYVWDGASYKQYNTQLDVGDAQARYLAPMQGFFIRVDSPSQSFSFDPSRRVIGEGHFISKTNATLNFSLQVRGGSSAQSDQCYFVIHPLATAQFEEAYDAVKLKNAADYLNFYSLAAGEKTAINSLSSKDLLKGVPLGFSSPEDSVFTISLEVENAFDYQVYLRDELLNVDHRIDLQDYSFSHKATNIEGRFVLYLRAKEVGQAEIASHNIFWSLNEGTVLFSKLPPEALSFSVMNLQGQTIYRGNKKAGDSQFAISPKTSNSYDFLIVKIEELNRSYKVILH